MNATNQFFTQLEDIYADNLKDEYQKYGSTFAEGEFALQEWLGIEVFA
jgi:hypothetical protein